MTEGSAERRRRAEYRAFVREHHPDVGGDAAAFVAGVAAFRQCHHSRTTQGRAAEHEVSTPSTQDSDTDGRDPYDSPIEIVHTGRVATRLVRWWRRTTGPPRVH